MRDYVKAISQLKSASIIDDLKQKMLDEERFLSIEQARIITRVYKENQREPVSIKRAKALKAALMEMPIRIEPGEGIVGNRTPGVRGGVVFPESGITWLENEIDDLPVRVQDRFNVRDEDKKVFQEEIVPYWEGKTLEEQIGQTYGDEIAAISKVAKINQKDHAQGHICPNTEKWLALGPAGIMVQARVKQQETGDPDRFYEGLILVMEGAVHYFRRYADLAEEMALSSEYGPHAGTLNEVARICRKLSVQPPESFYEALQSLWMLFVVLQMESNASSFSPGRMDQYLYPFYKKSRDSGTDDSEALQLIEMLWLKFNQIVYMRSSSGARYFAGFPIGFNVALGGQDWQGQDVSNELSFLFLQAQDHLGLPQPNLSARLFSGSPDDLVDRCSQVIGQGSGMPQIFNDEAVIPALMNQGIDEKDAKNYAIVGCVELTTQGNSLGWSDAAMFNLVKALELTLHNGKCLLSGDQIGLDLGNIATFRNYEELEEALGRQIEHFVGRMIKACEIVERLHAEILPSPFLSCVIDDCIGKGIDVTAGGACYNLSGIQAIQVANIADSLAAMKQLVFEEKRIDPVELLSALRNNFEGQEVLRLRLLNKAPKYGNDVEWVDRIGSKWTEIFTKELKKYTNLRGGVYHTGLYTVSAHVPMGQNVGASPDGRPAKQPLADGGMSAVYGRDMNGPTALLRSVSRIDSTLGSNGTLLNMKFSPQLFKTIEGIKKFSALLRTVVKLKISHIQFNVLTEQDMKAAQIDPESYKNMTVRVAGYTAYFVELAGDLQDEIIARTNYMDAI